MKFIKQACLAAALAATLLAPLAARAQTVVPLTVGGGWVEFDVDALLAPVDNPLAWIDLGGTPLQFSFTLAAPAELRVVDAGFAGDVFLVRLNGGLSDQVTSVVPSTDVATAANVGLDFDAAWADGGANFSRAALLLGPGSYVVEGYLLQTVQDGGTPLLATVGAVALAPVPEPASVATLLAGLLLVFTALRAHQRRG